MTFKKKHTHTAVFSFSQSLYTVYILNYICMGDVPLPGLLDRVQEMEHAQSTAWKDIDGGQLYIYNYIYIY